MTRKYDNNERECRVVFFFGHDGFVGWDSDNAECVVCLNNGYVFSRQPDLREEDLYDFFGYQPNEGSSFFRGEVNAALDAWDSWMGGSDMFFGRPDTFAV